MGRGRQSAVIENPHVQLAGRDQAATPSVGRRRDWQALADQDLERFALEVARTYEAELTAALKQASTPDDKTGVRWWERFGAVKLAQPRLASWGPILLYLAHWLRIGGELHHVGAGVYETSREELLEFVRAVEAGEHPALSQRDCFASYFAYRPL